MANSSNNHVFINCPYDSKYIKLLEAMIFTIVTLGYYPRLSKESSDGGEVRLNKIISLIESSMVSIHDLSRIQSRKRKEFYRLNMPFELGIDFGFRNFKENSKKFLILGAKPYIYIQAISDLSGVDLKYHYNKPIEMIKVVRDWFVENLEADDEIKPIAIWDNYRIFIGEFYDNESQKYGESVEFSDIPIIEQIKYMTKFNEDFFSDNDDT